MSSELNVDIKHEFARNFFNETGIVLRDRTQGFVRGSIGGGHDSGIYTNHVLTAVLHSPEIECSVSGIRWGAHESVEILLLTLENGQAFIYTGDTGEDDPVSIIGEVHAVRKIGMSIKEKISPREMIKNTDKLQTSHAFSWVNGYDPYDNFEPDQIVGDLVRLSTNHVIVSNPSLEEAKKFHFNSLFANIDRECFVVSHTGSINIIGPRKSVDEVTANVSNTFVKRGRKIQYLSVIR